MKSSLHLSVLLIGCMCLTGLTTPAQQSLTAPGGATASGAIPNLIKYSSVLKDGSGAVITALSGVTFLIYKDEQGGAPLWMETQNVQPDKAGHYTVQLGAVSKDGLPPDVFMTGEARWLAVQVAGETEQPRVALVAVPYAMKAADAQTLGGLPASAFMLAAPSGSNVPAASVASDSGSSNAALTPSLSAVTTSGGTANTIPLFTTATNIQNSILTQTATTAINVLGQLNLPATGKANSSTGFNSQPQDFVASVFNGTLALPETFQWQAEPVNNNKKTATGTLNLLFGSGGTKPAETGLNIASNGQITFAAGQTFPGGTVTGNESVNGNLSARGVVTGSSYQIGSNLFAFGSYANSNAFLGFAGNTGTTGFLNAASGYQALFSNTTGSGNTATGGGALYSNTTGNDNTGSGADALFSNTTGGGNTASGVEALKSNSTACCNTASGYRALYFNSAGTGNAAQGYQALYFATGSNNTGLGTYAGNPTNSQLATGSGNTYIGYQSNSGTQLALNNATAIGANAEVDASNSMVLGSINGVNGATASTNVGIGTTTPAAMLDVHGTGNFTGPITFTAGQTFPGGTVTGNESVNGNVSSTGQLISTIATGTAPLSVNSTTQVANLNASLLGGAPASAFATVGANAFTGNETVNGNLSATGVVSGSSFQIGSNLFDYGSYSSQDAFLGFAGNGTISGTGNTASGFAALSSSSNSGVFNTADGFDALSSNTSGFQNTVSGENALTNNTSGSHNAASGEWALEFNTTGSWNTAFGAFAGYSEDGSNITGSNNTFIGYQSAMSTGTLNNATAIGANAEVDASNSMVLGSINGVNGATVNTLVGIGTTAPRYLLHIGSQGGISYNNFLRVDGPASGSGNAISVGGHGDVGVDAVDVPNGRFVVKDNGIVAIGIPNPLINPFQIKQGLGHAIADGWTTYSSRRWKTNIQTLNGALAKIEQLRGVSYELKDSGKHQIGVIAEEVGVVVPEVVSWEKNGTDARSVDYGRLTALLIEATKEQQALIHNQQEQIGNQQEQIRVQQAQIARLTSQVRAIQTSLNTNDRTGSNARPVKAAMSVAKQ